MLTVRYTPNKLVAACSRAPKVPLLAIPHGATTLPYSTIPLFLSLTYPASQPHGPPSITDGGPFPPVCLQTHSLVPPPPQAPRIPQPSMARTIRTFRGGRPHFDSPGRMLSSLHHHQAHICSNHLSRWHLLRNGHMWRNNSMSSPWRAIGSQVGS